jgi:CRP-like cAMP-binding protein
MGYIAPGPVAPLHKPSVYNPVAVRDLPFRKESPQSNNLVLQALPVETLGSIERFIRPVDLGRQLFLFHEGDTLDSIYFPVTAVVSELRMLEDGRMVEIAVIGRDGAVGLSSVLLGSYGAPHTAQVSQPGTALRIDVRTFAELLCSNNAARSTMARYVDLYIRQISQKAICNMYHSVKERLSTWLLMATDRCRSETVDVTHDEISRILGVFRPSVTCTAQELRREKIITYERGGISICDRPRLERSACPCYLRPEWAEADLGVLP